MKAILALARKLLPEPRRRVESRCLVFPGELAGQVTDPWMRRVIALADGRPADEVAQALYLAELRRGGGTTDIGLWRSLFVGQVYQTLREMSARGYVQLICQDPGT